MALVVSRIQFNTSTGTTPFNVAHGLGVTPTACILWTTGRAGTTEGVGRQTMLRSVGMFVSTSSRAAVGSRSEDTPTLMVCDRAYRTDCCLVEVTNGGVAGLLDVTALDSTNIQFTPDAAFGTDLRVQGLVIAGTDNVFIGEAAIAAATGTQDFTSAGFTVTADEGFLLMAWATGDLAPPQSVIDSQMGVGCATAAGKQWVWTGGSNDGNGTSQTLAYCRSSEIFAHYDATVAALDALGAFNGFITNGFQLNITDAPPNVIRCPYLLVKGGRWHAGSLTTQTDTTTDITVSSLPATPLGGLFVSAGRAASTAGTASDNDEVSIGAVIDASTECASTCMDDDNAGTAAVGAGFSNDACYVNLDTASALEGEMHCTAVNGNGWTFRMTDADPAAAFVGFLAAMAASSGTTYDETVALAGGAELAIGFELESGLPDFAAEALLEFVEEVNPPALEGASGAALIPIATRSVLWDIFERRRR